MKLVIALVVVVSAVACDRGDKASTQEKTATAALAPETTPAAETTAAATTAAASPSKAVVFDIHPWPEEYHQLVATVQTEHSVEYREEPDLGSAIAARQTLESGSRISFGDSQTHVTRPFVAKATRAVKVSGATDDGEQLEQELVPGDAYEAYLYAGEGMCHARIAGKMAVGDCPDRQHFQAADWKGQAPVPAEYDLWLKTRKGWLLVDRDAVDLKSVSTL